MKDGELVVRVRIVAAHALKSRCGRAAHRTCLSASLAFSEVSLGEQPSRSAARLNREGSEMNNGIGIPTGLVKGEESRYRRLPVSGRNPNSMVLDLPRTPGYRS